MRIVLLLALAGSAFAQSFNATLRGTVTDSTGAVIAGAKIAIQNEVKGGARNATSDTGGNYAVPQLPPDLYTITVESAGFQTEVRKGLKLEISQETRVDFTLQVGSTKNEISVTGEVPLVQSENATVGNVVDEQKIKELPLNGREFWQLAQLAPNVFNPPQNSTLGFRGGFNVAGNPEVNNNYILDGVDNNDETTAQPTHRPSVDGIQEFRVLTGIYGAEYGRMAGGQVVVTTKSGSNEMHGTVFGFHRNDNLDARNFFNPGKLPELKRWQFGTSAGGRIVKDKLFYFGTYEGLRLGEGVAKQGTVPTEPMRTGNLNEFPASTVIRDPTTGQPFPNRTIPTARLDPTALKLMKYYPTQNLPGTANNYALTSVRTQDQNQFSTRVDWRISDKDSLFGSYQFSQRKNFEPSNSLCSSRELPGFGCFEPERTQIASLVHTHVFTPSIVNEFRFGVNRLRTNRFQEDEALGNVVRELGIPQGGAQGVAGPEFNNTGVPQVAVTGFSTIGGATNLPQGRRTTTYNLLNSISIIKGKHTIKAGIDLKNWRFSSFFTTNGRGAFSFNGYLTGLAYADFLIGGLRTTARQPGEPFNNLFTWSHNFYVQDDWQVTRNLTLNFGLRYELSIPAKEIVNKFSSYDPATGNIIVADGRLMNANAAGNVVEVGRHSQGDRMYATDTNNWAPRFGFAWRVFGDNKTVVRGGYGVFYNHIVSGNGISPMYRGLPFRTSQTFTNTATNIVATWTNPFPAGVSGGGLTPTGMNYNFPSAYVGQWSFGVQRQIVPNLVIETTYLGSKGTRLPLAYNINQPEPGAGTLQTRRPFNQWGAITYRDAVGTSNFHSLAVRVEKRYSQGVTFLTSYTFSKSIDLSAPLSTSGDGESAIQNPRNIAIERGLSEFDVQHRMVTSAVWDLPFGRGKRFGASVPKWADYAIGGWQSTGIVTLQTGRPFTVTTTRDMSNTGASHRPNVVGDPNAIDQRGPARWFNTQAFSDTLPAGVFAYGNAGTNLLRSDGIVNCDLSVFKNVPVAENKRLQFRFEFFNAFNKTNFGIPDRDRNSGTFGRISLTSTNSRQIQLGLKFIY
jgi:hypothetical protein